MYTSVRCDHRDQHRSMLSFNCTSFQVGRPRHCLIRVRATGQQQRRRTSCTGFPSSSLGVIQSASGLLHACLWPERSQTNVFLTQSGSYQLIDSLLRHSTGASRLCSSGLTRSRASGHRCFTYRGDYALASVDATSPVCSSFDCLTCRIT